MAYKILDTIKRRLWRVGLRDWARRLPSASPCTLKMVPQQHQNLIRVRDPGQVGPSACWAVNSTSGGRRTGVGSEMSPKRWRRHHPASVPTPVLRTDG